MASAAQRAWAAKHRAAAAADPQAYAPVRIKSSVDRAKEKTEKAIEEAAVVGREYRGPTPAQVAAGTLEVGTPTTAHRVQARAVSLLQPAIKTGEIPKELVALKVHEKTLGLMEQALSPDVHPIVSGVYRGTKTGWEKYQAQFGEYEGEYRDYSTEYERMKGIYEARQIAAEGLKRGEIGGVQVVTPTIPTSIQIPPIHEVKPIDLRYPLLEGLGKYAVAPPIEVRQRPPKTDGVVPLYEPIQEIKRRIVAGYGLGVGEPVDVEKIKPPEDIIPFEEYVTAPIYEKTTELTKRYKEWMGKQGIVEVPTGMIGEFIDPLRKFGTGIVRTPALLAETAGMVPLGVEFIIREPKVAIGIAPIGIGVMAGGLATGIRERPFETTGELTGMLLGPKVITKIIKPPKIPKIPIISDISLGMNIPIPKGLPVGKAIKFEAGATIAEALRKISPPIKKPLDFTKVKALGKAGEGVEAWIKANPEQQTVVGGSAAARTQIKGARLPGDIDINVVDVNRAASELYEIVSKVHGKDKTKVSYLPEYNSAKVKVKTNGWHDAVDIHSSVEPGALLRTGFPYKVQKPIEIGGIDYVPLGELIQRKAESILQSRRIGEIGPEAWRLKDVKDFEKFVSESIEHKFTEAQTSKMFKEYKKKKVEKLEQELIEYQTHVAYGPDPYQIRAAAVKYEKLPSTIKLPAALLVAAAPHPREHTTVGEVVKVPSLYPREYKLPYKLHKPIYSPLGERPFETIKKPPYTPAYKPVTYKVLKYPPYEPTYKPPPTTPLSRIPYEPIKLKKFYTPETDKKDRKKKRKEKLKGFQYFIENPISSPFGMSSVGRIKQK